MSERKPSLRKVESATFMRLRGVCGHAFAGPGVGQELVLAQRHAGSVMRCSAKARTMRTSCGRELRSIGLTANQRGAAHVEHPSLGAQRAFQQAQGERASSEWARRRVQTFPRAARQRKGPRALGVALRGVPSRLRLRAGSEREKTACSSRASTSPVTHLDEQLFGRSKSLARRSRAPRAASAPPSAAKNKPRAYDRPLHAARAARARRPRGQIELTKLVVQRTK